MVLRRRPRRSPSVRPAPIASRQLEPNVQPARSVSFSRSLQRRPVLPYRLAPIAWSVVLACAARASLLRRARLTARYTTLTSASIPALRFAQSAWRSSIGGSRAFSGSACDVGREMTGSAFFRLVLALYHEGRINRHDGRSPLKPTHVAGAEVHRIDHVALRRYRQLTKSHE